MRAENLTGLKRLVRFKKIRVICIIRERKIYGNQSYEQICQVLFLINAKAFILILLISGGRKQNQLC
ncbi:hypothetical protein BBH99_07475 [Chryseobacterium contaminans]|uniref:Transposase n=1 Tax=Chryseobacterium contaminans TaxID=1423959 RepID=A0ABX2X5Z2_9FLAO|nr:hypothetical protein BBH99_07475 [Chryseobacterium contaminans]